MRTCGPEGTPHGHLDQVEEKEAAVVLLLGVDADTLPVLALLEDRRVIHLHHDYPVIADVRQAGVGRLLPCGVLDQAMRRIVKRPEIPVTDKRISDISRRASREATEAWSMRTRKRSCLRIGRAE